MNIVKRHRHNGRENALRRPEERSDLFSRFLDDWDFGPLAGESWMPPMDLTEKADNIIARVELPGMKVEDIEIHVQGHILSISGRKKEESKQHDENYYHVERSYGEFRRDIALPAEVDSEKIEAHFRDGLLTVMLPKTEKARPRKISVKS